MLRTERILCPVDFSEFSARAYDYAQSVAQHYRAKLFVQHVVELWRYPYLSYAASAKLYDESSQLLLASGDQKLQEFVKSHKQDGIQPECVVQLGIATDCILSLAETQAVNLIVMGTHGRRGFDRLALGSVTEKVLRKARCPVLAVGKPAHDFVTPGRGRECVQLRRVLYCTDFSNHSERAWEHARSLATEYNAELTVLHVLENVSSSVEIEKETAKVMEHLQKRIPLEARKNCQIETAVLAGKAYERIIQLASESQTDLVITGVRGRNALDLGVFGSTTYRVIQLGPCPVLAVHI